ncbi:SDR family oxidoreductase [Pseudooceanicola sp. 216_PA32_1]|uniref:SDR family oxidoreductase n=1 Tax=Pseudooceanicola pacificus TaxID=2676438 RepID=A0A844W1M6_9RHOB|nr:SDR family oxidoreductase [Pseudooceanicola pacificus]MWB76604.1 SDR family oxidoreductase [Pseudooceanicola pacificus]
MDLQLKGKIAVVTGGSRGIGLAAAKALAAEGVDIAIVGRDRAAAEAAAQQIAATYGVRAIASPADTSDDASVAAMGRHVSETLGGIDIVVNCAAEPSGQAKPPSALEITEEHLMRHMNTKVMGYLRVARAALPHMTAQGWGRVISISGMGARRPGNIAGSIRNVGVQAMSKNLAQDLAGTGVTTSVIHPGMTRTEKVDEMLDRRAAQQGTDRATVEQPLLAGVLNGELPTAEDIAHIVAFLASPLSSAINGDVITAAGGSRGVIEY